MNDDRLRLRELLASLVGISALAVFVHAFVSAERFIYFWDFSGYWVATIRLGELLPTPGAAIEAIVESVRHQKYNLLAAIPLAPVSRLFDYDRTAWVLTVLSVYGWPAVFSLVLLAERLGGIRREAVSLALTVAVVVLLPALWAPLVRGSVGIGGVAIGVVLWLAVRSPLGEISVRRAVGCGVLLALLVLFRRWYAFWAVGFLGALVVEALVQPRSSEERRRAIARLASLGLTAGATLFVFATPMALRMISSDPSADRAAYRAAHFYLDGVARIVSHFGLLPLVVAGAGLVIAALHPDSRRLARLMTVQLVIVIALFLPTQRFDRHHYYLLAPQVAVLGAVALGTLERRARDARPLRWVVGAYMGVLLLGFGAAFTVTIADRVGPSWVLFGAPRYQPHTRSDLPEIVRLAKALDLRTRYSHAKVYVLASHVLLNEDVLKHAHYTTEAPDLSDRVLLSAHLDLREPFPGRLFKAEYVVVSDPVRLHLPPEEQEVILVPGEEILSGRGIGKFYRRLPDTFVLEDGTEVGIWKRTRPVPRKERERLRARLARDTQSPDGARSQL